VKQELTEDFQAKVNRAVQEKEVLASKLD